MGEKLAHVNIKCCETEVEASEERLSTPLEKIKLRRFWRLIDRQCRVQAEVPNVLSCDVPFSTWLSVVANLCSPLGQSRSLAETELYRLYLIILISG